MHDCPSQINYDETLCLERDPYSLGNGDAEKGRTSLSQADRKRRANEGKERKRRTKPKPQNRTRRKITKIVQTDYVVKWELFCSCG